MTYLVTTMKITGKVFSYKREECKAVPADGSRKFIKSYLVTVYADSFPVFN